MIYTMIAGAIAVVFGIALLLFPNALKGLSSVCDNILFVLDEYFRPRQKLVGIVLLLIGAWLLLINLIYPQLSLLMVIWIIALFFGLLFIAMPGLLKSISSIADQKVLDTDEYVRRSNRLVGIIFLLAGLYIIVIALMYR
ncbi:MAG TPA: hypothetical protein VMD02_03910 [Candidatus Omnitrophota bacterium]|nr:hypothetical protein [Candidatus Omnitrophota bacterium]